LGLDNTVTHWKTSEAFVHYSLFAAMFALAAAFVFFLVERDSILPVYHATMTTSAMICGVAAVAYYYLTSQCAPGKPFPTVVRYVDWTVTTLLLLKYPGVLKLRGFSLAWKLVLADLFMIVTGFIGELYGSTVHGHWFPDTAGAIGAHYVWGAISTLGYLVILFLLLTEGTRLAKMQPLPLQHGIKSMNLYLVSLRGVYPFICWFEGLSAAHLGWNINLDWSNVSGSVADVINKVGFGLTVYFAVKALSGGDHESPQRLSPQADRSNPLKINLDTGRPEGQMR
jgi:sensory rhodopsin